ncbi:MAG: YbjN domain-containing protein [Lachnospiraceae bacterium]|nr:YbjN domain-containing protein [Lachnospiraceae bacterium]
MIENTITAVVEDLEKRDIKVERVSETALLSRWRIEGGSIDLFIQFDLEGEMVRIIGVNFLNVVEKYWDCFYELINDLNDESLFATIILDKKEKQVRIEYAHIINEENCGDICFNLMMQIARLANKIYPIFMKTIWGGTTFIVDK